MSNKIPWKVLNVENAYRSIDCLQIPPHERILGGEVVRGDVVSQATRDLPRGSTGYEIWKAEFNGRDGTGCSIYFDESGWERVRSMKPGDMIGSLDGVVTKADVVMKGSSAEEQLNAISKSYLQKDTKLSSAKAFLKACEDYPELKAQYDREYRDEQRSMIAKRAEEAAQ